MDREVYDQSGNLLEKYDLNLGRLTDSSRTVHHPAIEAVEEVWHYETIREYPNGGKEVERVIDVPGVRGQDAWDEELDIFIYVPYTEDELAAMEEERNKPTAEDRILQLEAQNAMLTECILELSELLYA